MTQHKIDVVWHHATITRTHRAQLNGHKSFVLWFTGLSGSGKSTIAHATEARLYELGIRTFVFDGDNVRHGLCADLGFSDSDRSENLRRIGEMGKLFVDAGVIALNAFISPLRADRARIKAMFPASDFYEVFVDCSLDICEARDVKGMYKAARAGQIKNFTGISAPYEPPENPDLTLKTDVFSLEECVTEVACFVDRLVKM